MLAGSIGSSIRCSKAQQNVLWNRKGQKGDRPATTGVETSIYVKKSGTRVPAHAHTLRHTRRRGIDARPAAARTGRAKDNFGGVQGRTDCCGCLMQIASKSPSPACWTPLILIFIARSRISVRGRTQGCSPLRWGGGFWPLLRSMRLLSAHTSPPPPFGCSRLSNDTADDTVTPLGIATALQDARETLKAKRDAFLRATTGICI